MKPMFLQSFVDRLEKVMTIKTVYGEPIEREGRVIIPVAKVAFGAGGGGGTAGAVVIDEVEGEAPPEEGKAPAQPAEGQGGGAGGMVTPLGVLEITPEETTFIPITDLPRMLKMVAIGVLIGVWLGKKLK